MELNKLSKAELVQVCKDKKIKGFSNKNRDDLIQLITSNSVVVPENTEHLEVALLGYEFLLL